MEGNILLIYLSGKHFNTRNRLEPGETPSFSLLECQRLLEAFFGTPPGSFHLQERSFRLYSVTVPRASDALVQFLARAVSVHYAGTGDVIIDTGQVLVNAAIQAIGPVLAALPPVSFPPGASTFAVERIFHDMPFDAVMDLAIKRSVAGFVESRSSLRVSLKQPDVKISVFITRQAREPRTFTLALAFRGRHHEIKGINARLAKHRPVFVIGTMNPPLTAMMVNIVHPPRGHRAILVDPYCGTGGLLLEARARGIPVIGFDIDHRTIKGCLVNVRHFNKDRVAGFHLLKASALNPPLRPGDGQGGGFITVTDPPYGRLESLQHESFSRYIDAVVDIARHHDAISIAVPLTCEKDVLPVLHAAFKDRGVSIDVQPWVEHASFARSCVSIIHDGGV